MKVAVVGHVEWTEFVQIERVPHQGEIAHARKTFTEPAGGGAVAAAQLAALAGEATLFTALSADELGQRSRARLPELGIRLHASTLAEPQRRGFTYLDDAGERTITVIGERLGPSGEDRSLPWDELADADAVYFVSGDAAALLAARQARALVATARSLQILREVGVQVDALVGSAGDPGERYVEGDLDPAPRFVVRTEGAAGGVIEPGGVRWAPAPLPGRVADAYGCGDCFAAGIAYGLGAGLGIESAVALGARCGATVLTGHGPYGVLLSAAE
ncbi:MAG: ribokinase [Gaiellaceae bacterium]|nr:ribokinase [Gaiellaceae bacterium]